MRIFAEFFYHSHAQLKHLHDQSLMDLKQHVITVAGKWRQVILAMQYEDLQQQEFLDRVKRSAQYFADTLYNILAKPLELTAKVETNNKQAARRLNNALPDERQTWLSHRYLLTKMAERDFTISTYLWAKQHSLLDAIEQGDVKPKRQRKPRTSKKKNG